jgi:hypothetical protein
MDRWQLPLSLLEVAIGLVLVLGVVLGFALGVPAPDTRQPQLEAYAEDTATILSNEQPRHGGSTRLAEVVRSADAFERERDALRDRVERILTDNLLFRVETPHGAVGYHVPGDAATGRATVTTTAGAVTIRVWYA